MQYTIRNVPAPVDAALRERAHRERKSLNQLLVETLAAAFGEDPEPIRRDLSNIAGSWVDDPAVDDALAEQRTIDETLWK